MQEAPVQETNKTTETLQTTETSEGKEKFLLLAGYVPEQTVKPAQNQADEPERIVVRENAWKRGGFKGVLVATAVFGGVSFFGFFIFNTLHAITDKSTKKDTTPQKSTTSRTDPEEEQGLQKTQVALESQKTELGSLNNRDLTPTPTATPTTTPTATPSPTTISKGTHTVRTPTPTPPLIQRQTIRAPERIEMAPHFTPPTHQTQSQPQPQPQPIVKTVNMQPRSMPVATPEKSVNPNVAWQEAANIGMYGDGSDGTENKLFSKAEEQKQPVPSATPSPTTDYNNGRSVIIGSHAAGKLETAIALTGNGNPQSQQSYLIRLTEPLKSADGTIVIPKDALIATRVRSATDAGLLDMSVMSAIVREQNGVVEKSIPDGAILVQGGGGSPLKAEYHTPSHFGSDVRSAALAGIGKAAEIYNTSDSSISISNGGGSASSYSNSRRNIVAGVLQGSSQELVNRAQQANNQRLQRENNNYNYRILTLNKGASVQLYVNRSFAL